MLITTLQKNGIIPLPCIKDNMIQLPTIMGSHSRLRTTHQSLISSSSSSFSFSSFSFWVPCFHREWMLDLASAWFRHVVEWQRSKTSRVYPYDAETHLMSKGHTLLYVIMRGVSERSATGFIVDGVLGFMKASKLLTSIGVGRKGASKQRHRVEVNLNTHTHTLHNQPTVSLLR